MPSRPTLSGVSVASRSLVDGENAYTLGVTCGVSSAPRTFALLTPASKEINSGKRRLAAYLDYLSQAGKYSECVQTVCLACRVQRRNRMHL